MAQPVIESLTPGVKEINESPEEISARDERVTVRRTLSKFGECSEVPGGPEFGITGQSPIAFHVAWKGEDTKKKAPAKPIKKKRTKYVAPHQKAPPAYRPPRQGRDRKVVLTFPEKCRMLLEYCESHMPKESTGDTGGKKKKKKKKKQKLSHPMEFVSLFLELEIKPPKTTANLPRTIAALQQLLDPPQEESMEESAV